MDFKKVARQLVVVGLVSSVCLVQAASVAAGHTSTRRAAAGRIFRHALDDIKAEYGLDIYEFKPIHNIEQLGAHEARLHGPIIRMRLAAVDASDTAGEPYFTTSWRIINDRFVSVFHSSRDMRGCWVPGVSCVTDCIKTFAIKHTVRLFRGTQLCVVRPLEFRYTDVPLAPADTSILRVTQVMLFDHDRHIDSGEARGLVVDIDTGRGNEPYLRRAVGDERPTVFSLRYRDDSANGVQASQWHLAGYYAGNHAIIYHKDLRLERRFRRGHGPVEAMGAGTGV